MGRSSVALGVPGRGAETWRARLRAAGDGREVLGAGIGLGTRQVLTCAHVISNAGGPEVDIGAELVSWKPAFETTARVMDGCWLPTRSDQTADLALLELTDPVPSGCGTQLSQQVLDGLRVHMFGFPAELSYGAYVNATVAGRTGPGDEWVQLNLDQPVVNGYSGAAVVDLSSGHVVGMLVATFVGPKRHMAWMIAVDTILGYLPSLERWAVGTPSVSRELRRSPSHRPDDDQTARDITSCVTRSGTDAVLLIVTGGRASPISMTLRWVVARSDPPPRAATADQVERLVRSGLLPPARSIDLALDVAGKTVEEIVRAILGRLGRSAERPMWAWQQLLTDLPPRTLVLIDIDEAADPDALLTDVLKPLVRRAPERGLRLVLSAARRSAFSEILRLIRLSEPAEQLAGRIDRLSRAVDKTRRLHRRVAERFTDVPEPPDQVADWFTDEPDTPDQLASIHQRLAAVQAGLATEDSGQLTAEIESCERAVGAKSDAVHEFDRQLKAFPDRHRELTSRLELLRTRAGRAAADCPALDALYRENRELRDARPCDLTALAAAVERYLRAADECGEHGPRETPA